MKRILLSLCFSVSAMALSSQVWAHQWQVLSSAQEPIHMTKSVFPLVYQTYHLDFEDIKYTLLKAGHKANEGVIIHLPLGNGEFQTLKVFRDDVLPTNLLNKYGEIRTFTGFDPNNHSITAKIGIDVYGFNAMIIKPDFGTYMIDPYSRDSKDFYIGYLHKDLDASIYKKALCGVGNADQNLMPFVEGTSSSLNLNTNIRTLDNPSTSNVDVLRANGSVKRTYRLAISCTGEWAQAMAGTGVPPTLSGTLSSLVALVNRANGVFQRELSVKMEIIDGNDAIVFINPASDPYTCDGDNECLIDEIQAQLDATLMASSYDIGHIINTAGGGLAQLNSVCAGSGKGRGVSGAFSTSDIGTLVHEMGHQMGTHHTFIAETGGCSGNGNAATSYEPGSGTSIMSYNGACDPNNVPGPAYDYYHVGSLKMITDHIALGGGATCGTTEPGFGSTTIMTLGQSYNIPTNTPFELISTETEHPEPIMPESITYSWEQYDAADLGPTESDGATAENGPVFASRAPITKRDRQFPDYDLILSEDYGAVGQRLPTVERDMTFKLTTRSFFEGYGTFNYSEDVITVKTVEMTPFRVTAPNASALYEVGAPIVISWDTTKTRQEPILCGFVNIYMSRDGGVTFPTLVVANAPNVGSYTLAAPDVYSDNIIFKVKGSGNVFFDLSKTAVRIHGNPLSNEGINDIVENLIIYPNPTHDIINIENPFTAIEPLQVVMYDITGRILTTLSFLNNTSIDVSSFAKGNYFISIKNPTTGITHTEKIIVN